jgi:uncharacterized membrane protein
VEVGVNLPDGLFDVGWVSVAWLLYAGAMWWAFRSAPWYKVQGDRSAQHVLFGAALVLILIWNFSATIGGGFSFHFLLMTMITLMFGPQFALMAMTLGLLGVTLNGAAGWAVFGLNALLMGWLPIMLSWWLYKWSYRHLHRNFFVYVFLNGFLAAGVSTVVALFSAAGLMWLAGVYDWQALKYNFLVFVPMLAAPEAFINGFLIAGLVLMKPQWVSTFSDEQYLHGK